MKDQEELIKRIERLSKIIYKKTKYNKPKLYEIRYRLFELFNNVDFDVDENYYTNIFDSDNILAYYLNQLSLIKCNWVEYKILEDFHKYIRTAVLCY
jgi:hypothetical protein